LDQAIITPIADVQRPWHMSRRRSRRLGPVLLISLWLHLTLLRDLGPDGIAGEIAAVELPPSRKDS
jgi:hypothetical protein